MLPSVSHSRRALFAALLNAVVLIAALVSLPSAWAQSEPEVLIQKVSDQVIQQIRQDKTLKEGDVRRIGQLVDTTIMPHVNFERMTALSVGRGWRDATPEQRKRLQQEFRELLLRTYAGALSAVDNETSVRLRPMRSNPADEDVVVRSEIVQRRGQPIQLDYRMEKTPGGWKIYDLNVLGVWLIETYRSQFGQQISASGIDGLIKSLADKNAQYR